MTEGVERAKAPGQAARPAPPRHVAIIMDGNRRWAKARLMPGIWGHRAGVNAVRNAVQAAGELGIKWLTLYSFSSENWNRPAEEVDGLMGLLRRFINEDLEKLHAKGVRVRVIGSREMVAGDIVDLISKAEALTRDNTALNLMIAFNYGGQDEIVDAARAIAREVAEGRLAPEAITRATIEQFLQTSGAPHPDLVIRTSGEKRLSNFLIWQSAYAELVFVDELWPDFTKATLEAALGEYHRRDRRFGADGPERQP